MSQRVKMTPIQTNRLTFEQSQQNARKSIAFTLKHRSHVRNASERRTLMRHFNHHSSQSNPD